MTWLKNFLKSHSITTHTIVVVTLAVLTMYNQVPAFHAYILHVYGLLPTSLRNVIEVVIACVAWYWRTKTPQQ